VATSASEKALLEEQWARAFYSCRFSFSAAEDPEFQKAMELMRPGVGKNLLGRKDLAGRLLDAEHDKIDGNMRARLEGKNVVLSQDGWSNIHREPIIASCLHVPGRSFLHDAEDVGDTTKDAAYCANLAKTSIVNAEEQYGCKVVGFVSDSESKMVRVREILKEWRREEFITYGCSAHYLNLVQSEVDPPAVAGQIIEVQKFFRNHQKPAAKLSSLGGVIPQLKNDTRWLSFRAMYETFLQNYESYLKILDEETNLFPANIKKILYNRQILEGARHMLSQLNTVAQSLNVMQSDYSNIGDACNSWLTLLESPDLSEDMKSAIKRRMKVAVTPHHILAQMVMNKEGCPIPVQMKEEAQVFLEKIDGSFSGVLAEIQDTSIFPASAFSAGIKSVLDPIKYWEYISQ
jgi:hypothetical protein